MVTLTVTFKEIFDLLKKNTGAFPENLNWDKNVLGLVIPRKDGDPIPIDGNLTFSRDTFRFKVNSGEIKLMASLTFTVEELFGFFKASMRELPEFLEKMEWNKDDQAVHLVIEPKEETPEEEPAFQKTIELLARLKPNQDDGIRLRIAAA